MTFKNNRAPLLCYFKLCAAFCSHWWIQTGVTVWKRLIWVKIDDFFSRVTLKFDGWPSKTIGHLFYATSSFVQHFVRPAKSIKLDVAVNINKNQLFKTKYWISPNQHEVIHWVHCVSPCSCILGDRCWRSSTKQVYFSHIIKGTLVNN